MPDLIFITSCPTSGKSTISKLLQEKLKTPMFEFGWIPEFKNQIKFESYQLISQEILNRILKHIL